LIHRFIGFWVLRRAWRLLAADDSRPLRARLTAEAKRILVGAVVTFALVLVAAIAAVGVLIWLLV
jgi:nitrate reductase NapE component